MPAVPRCWIFDLDGTLVHSEHDYAALKRRLGLPPELAVLEGVETRPEAERLGLFAEIDAWEREHAARATPVDGAHELLGALLARGRALAILTRNTRMTALATLGGAGLAPYFDPRWIVGRHEAAPKPSPEGVRVLLRRWGANPEDTVLVGDFRYDLEAAHAAGVAAIWYDPQRTGTYAGLADRVVHDLRELAPALVAPVEPHSAG